MRQSLRTRVFRIVNVADFGNASSRRFDIFIIFLILLNVSAALLKSIEPVNAVMGQQLDVVKAVSLTAFVLEYLLRLWTCPEHNLAFYRKPFSGRFRYLLSPLMLIDLIAILPWHLLFSGASDFTLLRLFRLLWLLRTTRNSRVLQILLAVIRRETMTLVATLIVMVVVLVVISSIIYSVEHEVQPDIFASIPHAMWWSMATLTTVGYGDAVPQTTGGKMFGVIVMFVGIGMFAVPTGMLVSAFLQEIKRKDFIATWALVAKVPFFSSLSAIEIAAITDLLRLKTAMPGEVIFRKGTRGDSMYFIVVGAVEIDLEPKSIQCTGGDFFGELAILYKASRSATVTAKTFVELLQLDARDIETLLESNPKLRQRITEEAELRKSRTDHWVELHAGENGKLDG